MLDTTQFLFVCLFLDSAWPTTAGSVAPAKSSTFASTEPGKQVGELTESRYPILLVVFLTPWYSTMLKN